MPLQETGGFKTGIAALRKTDPALADYLEKTREWSEPLISLRNDLHEGWVLPKFAYKDNSGAIEVLEPQNPGAERIRLCESHDRPRLLLR
jgi:hypothetical protein